MPLSRTIPATYKSGILSFVDSCNGGVQVRVRRPVCIYLLYYQLTAKHSICYPVCLAGPRFGKTVLILTLPGRGPG